MGPRTVLVPYDGSEDADRMLRLACQTVGAGGRVVVLALTQVHQTLPLADLPAHFDEPTLRVLHRAWEVVRTVWDASVDVEIEPCLRRTHHAANTILHQADTIKADAIYLALKQPRFSWLPLRLGGTTRTIMQRAPCPVLVGRFPSLGFSPSDVLEEAHQVLQQNTAHQ
jgi:nucleotide-binding universal stress UspA family protein